MDIEKILELLNKVADGFNEYKMSLESEDVFWDPWQELYDYIRTQIKPNKVTTITYGKAEEWDTRQDAIKFFIDAINGCEGAERDRYVNVYMKLINGYDVCSDD